MTLCEVGALVEAIESDNREQEAHERRSRR